MPSYVIMRSAGRIGETIDATLCDLNAAGFPDRRTDVPVRVRLVSERVLAVDDDPRGIIWSEGGSGTTTFLVDGSTRGLRNRERRAALARASELLRQLTSTLMPLAVESEEPGFVAENLQLLFDWIARERERATIGADGARR
ncbi:MAG TPA: hypothetical protein VKE42_04915 [Candidatus Cybelea sp.]|nr:hypothetical protein [Candidatus Cybelea sp.]